jgi:hypothetical protein
MVDGAVTLWLAAEDAQETNGLEQSLPLAILVLRIVRHIVRRSGGSRHCDGIGRSLCQEKLRSFKRTDRGTRPC